MLERVARSKKYGRLKPNTPGKVNVEVVGGKIPLHETEKKSEIEWNSLFKEKYICIIVKLCWCSSVGRAADL